MIICTLQQILTICQGRVIMANVYAEATDSWRRLTDNSSWANARGTVSSSSSGGSSSASHYNFGIFNAYTGGRGANTYYCSRTFFEFDLSGESGTVSSAYFRVYVDNVGTNATNESTIYVVNATALADGHADYGNVFEIGVEGVWANLTKEHQLIYDQKFSEQKRKVICNNCDRSGINTMGWNHADYGNVFSSGTTIGTLLGSGESTTTDGYLNITLNSAGISALNSAVGSGTLTIGCMGYYDYNNSAPPLGGDLASIKFTFADYTGTSRDPYLNITYAAAAADNAIFFGTNF